MLNKICRIENRTGSRKLKLRQVGQDESSWQILRPHSTLAFAWENLHGEQCLELLLDGVDPSKSTNIDINQLGDHPMVTTGRTDSSDVCVRVLGSSPPTTDVRRLEQFSIFVNDIDVMLIVIVFFTLSLC